MHLERALAVGDRLGGHIVTGHVDGKVRLREREELGEASKLVFEIEDPPLARFVAPKGSVAVDGVSLTVNGVAGAEFDVVIIPHTLDRDHPRRPASGRRSEPRSRSPRSLRRPPPRPPRRTASRDASCSPS